MYTPNTFFHWLKQRKILHIIISALILLAAYFLFRSTYFSNTNLGTEITSPGTAHRASEKFSAAEELTGTSHSGIGKNQPLVLTFAGDLMAHTVNFNMEDYSAIYTDVQNILHTDDVSFVNVETPVCDELPLSSYPSFNVHTAYLRAAFTAGFDVFSFANNHTNDKNVRGINGTLAAVQTLQAEQQAHGENKQTEKAAKRIPLAYSGLKNTTQESFAVTKIHAKNWNILFCAVTELLNSYDSSKDRLYYSPPTTEGRKALCAFIEDARKQTPCDLFVLSLHVNEPEYGRTVSAEKKEWFKQLGEAGVDIIWAHHPHVMQEWETITVERTSDFPDAVTCSETASLPANRGQSNDGKPKTASVFCMYSMGNFISGQRWQVRYENPAYYREYTGDAVMLQTVCSLGKHGLAFTTSPFLITQYNAPRPVVKLFTPAWIEALEEKEKRYFKKRFELMHEYLPLEQNPNAKQDIRQHRYSRCPIPIHS